MDAPPRRKHLRRIEHTNHLRHLTFSTYQRLPLFATDHTRDLFAAALADLRTRAGFHLYAWVLMPEHTHILLWPRLPDVPVPKMLRSLKSSVARSAINHFRATNDPILPHLIIPNGSTRFWQRGGGYDRNLRHGDDINQVIEYIHHNPVRRALVSRATDWHWSSARWYAGDRSSPVTIDPLPPKRPM